MYIDGVPIFCEKIFVLASSKSAFSVKQHDLNHFELLSRVLAGLVGCFPLYGIELCIEKFLTKARMICHAMIENISIYVVQHTEMDTVKEISLIFKGFHARFLVKVMSLSYFLRSVLH